MGHLPPCLFRGGVGEKHQTLAELDCGWQLFTLC
jgi:hypothetical protein